MYGPPSPEAPARACRGNDVHRPQRAGVGVRIPELPFDDSYDASQVIGRDRADMSRQNVRR